eukprot:357719-Chlamydomonas_euryale.AAC.4
MAKATPRSIQDCLVPPKHMPSRWDSMMAEAHVAENVHRRQQTLAEPSLHIDPSLFASSAPACQRSARSSTRAPQSPERLVTTVAGAPGHHKRGCPGCGDAV